MKRPISVLTGLATSALAAFGALAPAAAADQPVRIGLLPLVVHSSGRSDYLRNGLGDMLFTRIDARSGVSAIRIAADGSASADLADALSAGRAAGADYVVFGSFTRFGDGASLDLFCAPVAHNGDKPKSPRELFIQSGSLAEIIPALDGLVEKMLGFVANNGSPVNAVSASAPSPAPEAPTAPADYDDLRSRIEALERILTEAGYLDPPAAAEQLEDGSETP